MSGPAQAAVANADQWRAECEARHVLLGIPSRAARHRYLARVAQVRGDTARARLHRDVIALWHRLRTQQIGQGWAGGLTEPDCYRHSINQCERACV